MDDEVEAVAMLLADPDFKHMGPYTHPREEDRYHSNDVELAISQQEGNPPPPLLLECCHGIGFETAIIWQGGGSFNPDYLSARVIRKRAGRSLGHCNRIWHIKILQ